MPANNIEAERAVLSIILVDGCDGNTEAYEKASQYLKPENFYRISHQLLFEAMGRIVRHGGSPDIVAISEQIERMDKERDVDGAQYELVREAYSMSSLDYYAGIVRDLAT